MIDISHWSLRYLYNKFQAVLYEKMFPNHPWLTKDANKILSTLLKPTDIGLEFGSGRSTIWFAKRIKHLTSIEEKEKWYNIVSGRLSQEGLENVALLFRKPEEYTEPLSEIKDNSLDFVLVDGCERDKCVNEILTKIKSGGILVIDNAERHFNFPSVVPYSLYKKGKEPTKEFKEFMNKTKDWRHIWTTNGVFDTIIMFKGIE